MFSEDVKKLIIRTSKLSEVFRLASHLRPDDIEECEAWGVTPLKALRSSYHNSFIRRSIYLDNKIIAMFGAFYQNDEQTQAGIWFLGSKDIENFPVFFVREGKKFVQELKKRKLFIFNYVWAGNKTHIDYINHIGCEVKPNLCYIAKGFFYLFISKEY